eukprot:11145186-Ditylum_brightwellii.AAC.1
MLLKDNTKTAAATNILDASAAVSTWSIKVPIEQSLVGTMVGVLQQTLPTVALVVVYSNLELVVV